MRPASQAWTPTKPRSDTGSDAGGLQRSRKQSQVYFQPCWLRSRCGAAGRVSHLPHELPVPEPRDLLPQGYLHRVLPTGLEPTRRQLSVRSMPDLSKCTFPTSACRLPLCHSTATCLNGFQWLHNPVKQSCCHLASFTKAPSCMRADLNHTRQTPHPHAGASPQSEAARRAVPLLQSHPPGDLQRTPHRGDPPAGQANEIIVSLNQLAVSTAATGTASREIRDVASACPFLPSRSAADVCRCQSALGMLTDSNAGWRSGDASQDPHF